MNKTVLTPFTILCLLFTVFLMGLAFNIQPARASGTIYIRADGSVDPPAAPIQQVGNIYTLEWNIYDSIVVERSNITVDGNGYTLQGSGIGIGMNLTGTSNVTIMNMKIESFAYGIWLYNPFQSSNNKVLGNMITNNTYGVWVFASNNTLSGNTIADNSNSGVVIDLGSSNNTISRNKVMNNTRGFWVIMASDNKIYQNNLINNIQQVDITMSGYANSWDDDYPSGGNYWSDYTGVDLDHDGIGDSSHTIDANNTDRYPLMGMFSDFNATSEHRVQTICNSTISDFYFNGTAIRFNVIGDDGTVGFCRICIPTALMNDTFRVFVNSTEIIPPPEPLPCSNSTHNYLYFTYSHSAQEVVIIPEFPSFLLLPLFMITTLITVIVYRRKPRQKHKHNNLFSFQVHKL